MELDERLRKIATGISVSDAVDAYLSELQPDGAAKDQDRESERTEEILAVVEILFLMAAVDGEIADDEVRELRAGLAALRDLEEVSGRIDLDAVMADLGKKLARDGWKARLDSAAARVRAPEARAFAFRLAAGVAFVDDFVAHAEAAAIDAVAKALALPEELQQRLLREVYESLFARP